MGIQKTLYLLRHGEAEPGIGHLGDLRRPLTEKGINYIKSLSGDLKSRKVEVDRILVSPSLRTSQTAAIISEYIPHKEIQIHDEIYDAEVSDLVRILQKIEPYIGSILLIGHNPALSTLVSKITGVEHINMPPGMLAIVEIVVNDWADVGIGTGILTEMVEG
jgi:phosphohistidine phosphatase